MPLNPLVTRLATEQRGYELQLYNGVACVLVLFSWVCFIIKSSACTVSLRRSGHSDDRYCVNFTYHLANLYQSIDSEWVD